jgi:hypothetical protein
VKREGLEIATGHLPTVDITMEIGAASEVVEVSGQAPVIDVTTNTNQTNVTQDVIDNGPHGYSFQSVIQFAPMARNEPLAGSMTGTGGTGGSPPGSTSSGSTSGYSIGGAADSESTYLVEGQDTENISMGFSNANVPFQFIQEVQVKTSGIEAEHGGALGGVVNVIMKKGSNAYHGSLFGTYESDSMDGSPIASLRYDPFALGPTAPFLDNNSQTYQPKKDHFRYVQPGFNVGGPIMKDRIWFFAGFAPFYQSTARTVNFGANICNTLSPGNPSGVCPNYGLGSQLFTRDSQQYFGTLRLDATLTQKIRVFGSWLYQYGRETGANLPNADPENWQSGYIVNRSILGTTLQGYSHGLGFASPNSSYSTGADITITPKIVSTTRFGYYFNNYHDFGWPTSGSDINWGTSGLGVTDNTGGALPTALQQGEGAFTTPYNGTYTLFNASKHYQLDENVAFFKSGWAGTHNIKVGYQYNRMSNVIDQNGNVPNVELFVGAGQSHGASTSVGGANCDTLGAVYKDSEGNPLCAGQYGYAEITDFATVLKSPAIDNNHAFFVQDAWTVGHGLTLNLGLRIEKEDLPVPNGVIPTGFNSPNPIHFSWSDKIEPRLGAAWGSANGKLKIFGSYGVVNDVMKLLLAQTSWGAQGYNTCSYPLGPNASGGFNLSDITTTFVNGRACPNGTPTTGANFTGGTVPPVFTDAGTGTQLIENVDYRPWEPVAPGVKPYRQHEFVAGVDYQLSRNWALEGRYDRRRLDHAIEDASLADPQNFEIYTIVNPGEGVNKTIDGYGNFLDSLGSAYGVEGLAFSTARFGTCPTCPNIPKAIRNYDGVEVRVTKTASKGWAGMFSYTWSSLWGNYTGLTTTDQTDGGSTGRASPDTTRSFDEPYYYYTYQGKNNAGPLPTDRPNTFKGNVYYTLPWKGMNTTLGLFQVAYQGSPVSTAGEVGIGYTSPIEDTYMFGRGKWVNVTQDPNTGALSFGNPYVRRTPWFTQTDANFMHTFKVNKNNEHQTLSFQATVQNLFNQRAVVAYWESLGSYWNAAGFYPVNSAVQGGTPQSVFGGAPFYQAAETGYDLQASATAAPFITHSGYGRPNLWQRPRALRLGVQFTF